MQDGLLTVLEETKNFKQVLNYYEQGQEGEIIGLEDSSRDFFIANLTYNLQDSLLLITSSTVKADEIYEDLVRLLGEDKVLLFPSLEILPHESLQIEETIKVERLKVLKALHSNLKRVIITPIQTLLQKIIPPQLYEQYLIELNISTQLETTSFSSKLIKMGYERVDMVETRGEFSIKGGIIDIFPASLDKAVRIELFGDQIDSIRKFNVKNQSSIKQLTDVIIGPATEFIIPNNKIESSIDTIKSDLKLTINEVSQEISSEIKNKIDKDLERIKEGIYFSEVRQYLKYFYQSATLLNYYTGIVVFDNLVYIKKAAIEFLQDINQTYSNLLSQGKLLCGYQNIFVDYNQFLYQIDQYKLYLAPTKRNINEVKMDFNLEFKSRRAESFQGKIDLLINNLKQRFKEGYRIVIGLSNLTKADKLQSRLQEANLPAVISAQITDQLKFGNIILTVNNLANGFLFKEAKFIFYTENELFKKNRRKRKRAKAFNQGTKISSFTDLNQGDYVVHENHGIGKYMGIKTLKIQNRNKDYLFLSYANDDKLYVPTDQVDLIQKYVGLEDKKPKLYKLDDDSWNKAKARVKKSVEEMAEELLELYAKRETKKGYSFSEDTVWQKDFEAQFPYQETKDQLEAIEDVKNDMESKQPMDRLLCGDVGYGKTEVAIRAIFKAIMDGKQVAFLVPTTILAQQHWNNLVDRFNKYPINVAMLSRFRTETQQKDIIEKLKLGTIDVIVGTHRLLSHDVKFNNLGLVIVDEEQRFGVKQKEKLKQLKESVDVLTLSATPIPRTLHMSLVGVRDISLIETPPENRYPIRTYVGEYQDQLVQEALKRELNRKGQVYFVHNQIKDIDKVANKIKDLVPKAKIGVAHGQMSETKLESLMLDFLEEKYDILVCTTIIETGLDISNVNTIIIDQADKMGLSQLYQLRGRVGRSNRIAYAYLLYDQEKILSEIAEKRLKAIKEFTSLGSGFKIAMRDLEIRGAGNILGPEQHGHIEAIGFSLYCKLLEGAIKELQNANIEEQIDIALDLKVDAYLSEDYIPDSKQKIEIYKKIDSISTIQEYYDLKKELIDRFGNLPMEVIILIELAKIKIKGTELGLTEIKEKNRQLYFNFSKENNLSGNQLINLAQNFNNLKFLASKTPKLEVKVKDLTDSEKINLILDILEFLSSTNNN